MSMTILKTGVLILLSAALVSSGTEDSNRRAIEAVLLDQPPSCLAAIKLARSYDAAYADPRISNVRVEEMRDGLLIIRLADNPGIVLSGIHGRIPTGEKR